MGHHPHYNFQPHAYYPYHNHLGHSCNRKCHEASSKVMRQRKELLYKVSHAEMKTYQARSHHEARKQERRLVRQRRKLRRLQRKLDHDCRPKYQPLTLPGQTYTNVGTRCRPDYQIVLHGGASRFAYPAWIRPLPLCYSRPCGLKNVRSVNYDFNFATNTINAGGFRFQ